LTAVKSTLLKQLSQSYPNFRKKNLEKFSNIILNEIMIALQRGERIELRGFGVFSTRIQKESIRRNPKSGEKILVKKKRVIHWKMSKELFKKINNEKE